MADKDIAIARAGQVLAAARARRDSLSPAEAAALAATPGGPPVDVLAACIGGARCVDTAA